MMAFGSTVCLTAATKDCHEASRTDKAGKRDLQEVGKDSWALSSTGDAGLTEEVKRNLAER